MVHNKIEFNLKMVSVIAKLCWIERCFRNLRYDDRTNIRQVNENVGIQSELSNADELEPLSKRRKVVKSLCINKEYLNRIVRLLEDGGVATIGVYGMCGVGKTAIVTELRTRILNHDENETSLSGFHEVALVSVGVDFDLYQLQQKIADAFGVDLRGDKNEVRRAAMMYEFLNRNDSKCVLVLDDLWTSDFSREDVGLPRNCKLVVVSRSLDVCRRLRCQKFVKVEPLSEEDSWELFHHSIGGYGVSDSKEVAHIGKLMYEKSAGLPLGITELASSLSRVVDNDGNTSRWREILESIDFHSTTMIPTYMENTFMQLKLSYERLNDVKLQLCFLYTALYPKGYAISREELIRLWIGEKLIDDVSSLHAQYNKGHSILNKLLNSCLLESCEDSRRIKIHDLVRHMAISIAGDRFKVEAGIPATLVFQENLHVVSWINSSISVIPSDAPQMYCHLSTLLLQHNPIESIPEPFFLHMRALQVLNLSDTRISRLPNSIGALEELRVLDISCCENLKQVPSLSKLVKLQFLDLSQTAIGQVPRSLEMLIRLVDLNLTSFSKLKKIPCGVLPALFRLKRLICNVDGIIEDLQRVNSLEFLDARFSNLCDLSSYVMSKHWCILESYHLQVGCEAESEQSYSKRVSLYGCSLSVRKGDYIVLPNDVQELYIDNCRDFRSLSDAMYPVSNHHNNDQNQQAEVFSVLEICNISRCPDIETLFASSWMGNLQSLELLQVTDCGGLKEIITQEAVKYVSLEGKHAVISLPQLRRLVLTQLPQINSIYKGRLACGSLRLCTFMDCPELKHLPFSIMDDEEGSFPYYLERIEGQEKWWDSLEWDQTESEALLKPLFTCKSLDGSYKIARLNFRSN